jgi:hypothetical protein
VAARLAQAAQTNAGRGVIVRRSVRSWAAKSTGDHALPGRGRAHVLICRERIANALARATMRSRELAIRSALGAGGAVLRQLLTESVVCSPSAARSARVSA